MTEIRPLLVSYADTQGGAARAAYRLLIGLQNEDIDARMLVARKWSSDPTVSDLWLYRSPTRRKMLARLEYLPRYPYRNAPPGSWSNNLLPTLRGQEFARRSCNLVNLHWVGEGFVPIRTVAKINKPLVWTLHDMWPFTGGCHYSGTCTRYTASCGACPQLASTHPHDLSHHIWQTKHTHWHQLDFTVVSPSRWLAACARQSSLFAHKRIEVIPYGIDAETYHPLSKQQARAQLGLPADAHLILFGAIASTSDPRKGYQLLLPALHHLAHERAQARTQEHALPDLHLVVVGANEATGTALPPIPTHYAGYVRDEHKLAALYAAADLFVAPSLEDNLPNAVMEALACGTPTVAFAIGGMPDMIEHQRNGYLATPFAVEDLAQGMAWVLADAPRQHTLAQRARSKVMEEFTLHRSAQRYAALYAELLHDPTRSPRPSGGF